MSEGIRETNLLNFFNIDLLFNILNKNSKIYWLESAFPLPHILLNPTLSFSNRKGRLAKIPSAISAKESVVNLAMPHWDEAKAIIDNCMEIPIKNQILSEYSL